MAMMNQKSASPATTQDNATFKKIAIIFAAVCVLALLLPVTCIYYTPAYSMYTSYSHMLIVVFFNVLGSYTKISGVPVIGPGALGIGSTIGVYIGAIGVIAALVLAIVAIFNKKNPACILKTALFLFTWAMAIYCLTIILVSSYLMMITIVVDMAPCLLAIAGALCFFFLLWKENKRSALLIAGQFLLSLLTAGFIFLALTVEGLAVAKMLASPRAKFLLTIAATAAFGSLFLASLTSMKHNKWTAIIQLINCIAALALSVCLILVSHLTNAYIESYLKYTIFATITAFLGILLCVIGFSVLEKNAKDSAEDLYLNNYELEEYVEVVAYNPEKAQYAEKVETKAAAATEAPAATEEEIADDPEKEALFEGKEDAFIATLSKAEKYEFADLYILKTKGNLGAIPTYEVGAENKAFFKKVFIYLSQYREKISSELLAKIYDYSEQA